MLECRIVRHLVSPVLEYKNKNKTNDAGTGPELDKAETVRCFLVRYRTELMDAGMPMTALVSSISMTSCV